MQHLESTNQVFQKEIEEEQYVRAEINFHNTYMKISGNPLIVEMYTLVLKFMQVSASVLLSENMIRQEAYEVHEEIIAALSRKDEKACEKAVKKHLKIARNNLKNYFENSAG